MPRLHTFQVTEAATEWDFRLATAVGNHLEARTKATPAPRTNRVHDRLFAHALR